MFISINTTYPQRNKNGYIIPGKIILNDSCFGEISVDKWDPSVSNLSTMLVVVYKEYSKRNLNILKNLILCLTYFKDTHNCELYDIIDGAEYVLKKTSSNYESYFFLLKKIYFPTLRKKQ